MRNLTFGLIAFFVFTQAAFAQGMADYFARSAAPDFFDKEIAKFVARDAESMPPEGGVLFIGSSSILQWNSLAEDLAPFPVINRGFGGSQTHHVNRHFDTIVAPYKPKALFYYCGENDIAGGKSQERLLEDFSEFLSLRDAHLPGVPVYFISIKPSIGRIEQFEDQTIANTHINAMADEDSRLHYVDVVGDMMDGDKPKDIFLRDQLHMNADGYAIWTSIMYPLVEELFDGS